jgi:hypothetical protein
MKKSQIEEKGGERMEMGMGMGIRMGNGGDSLAS